MPTCAGFVSAVPASLFVARGSDGLASLFRKLPGNRRNVNGKRPRSENASPRSTLRGRLNLSSTPRASGAMCGLRGVWSIATLIGIKDRFGPDQRNAFILPRLAT